MNEADIKIANDKANKLIQWIIKEDLTVDQSILMLTSVIISIAKNFKLSKLEVDRLYNSTWQAVQLQEKR